MNNTVLSAAERKAYWEADKAQIVYGWLQEKEHISRKYICKRLKLSDKSIQGVIGELYAHHYIYTWRVNGTTYYQLQSKAVNTFQIRTPHGGINLNWQRLADTAWTSAQERQWICAVLISTRHIYTCKIPPAELSQLRGAREMYAFISAQKPQDARRLRKQYPYRRFYELYRLWRLHEFSADDCIEYLEFDGGIAGMCAQVEDMHGEDEWLRKSRGIYATVGKFTAVAYGAPEWFTTWAAETKALFEKNGIK